MGRAPRRPQRRSCWSWRAGATRRRVWMQPGSTRLLPVELRARRPLLRQVEDAAAVQAAAVRRAAGGAADCRRGGGRVAFARRSRKRWLALFLRDLAGELATVVLTTMAASRRTCACSRSEYRLP